MVATSHHTEKNPAVTDINAVEAADPRKLLSRKECQVAGNWGQSTQIAKEAGGVLHRVLVGTSVRITAKSFYAHLRDLAAAPPRKARQPKTMFKPRRRAPLTDEGRALAPARKREAKAAVFE
jgi:hypothetical protein